jgi:hypothetical protein
VPGKNPADAIRAYLHPLQQSLSCFSDVVLRSDGYDAGVIHTATFPVPTVELITRDEEILHLSFIQQFNVEQRLLIGWKVRTRSYMYSLECSDRNEIFAFHWHPEATPDNPVIYPHLHISSGAGERIRREVREIHFRTDRVAFEEFALILIDDFRVDIRRQDARLLLAENLVKFKTHKSW